MPLSVDIVNARLLSERIKISGLNFSEKDIADMEKAVLNAKSKEEQVPTQTSESREKITPVPDSKSSKSREYKQDKMTAKLDSFDATKEHLEIYCDKIGRASCRERV